MTNAALLLTQYERFGSVGHDEYIELYIDEELEITISDLGEYNEYLRENGYDDDGIFDFDALDDYIATLKPWDAFQLARFSDISMNDEYFQFNGYGNLKSMSEREVVRIMQEDRDFLRWYVEHYVDLDDEEEQAIIDKSNELIAAGF